jgi:thioredoxin-related protein
MEKKLEMFANAAIIIVAISVIGVFGYGWLKPSMPPKQIEIGSTVSLPDTVLAKKQTLLVVLQKGCRFCSESSPFYRKLAESVKNNPKTNLIAVLPTDIETSKKYLNETGVQIDEIKQLGLDKLQVQGTPTLILLDQEAKVIESWVGKLPAEVEAEVIQKVL